VSIIETLEVSASRRGLCDVTSRIQEIVSRSGVESGLCHVFLQHTSASLCIQENADPTARGDLEEFFDRLVPEDTPWFEHTAEGPDDMPSHIKTVLSDVSVLVPVLRGRLALGTWQGIYLWEHRDELPLRRMIVSVWPLS
jgi:secondary thiamine-phosphate synthase enzyme